MRRFKKIISGKFSRMKINFLVGFVFLLFLHLAAPGWAAEESPHWQATWAASAMPMNADVRNRIADLKT